MPHRARNKIGKAAKGQSWGQINEFSGQPDVCSQSAFFKKIFHWNSYVPEVIMKVSYVFSSISKGKDAIAKPIFKYRTPQLKTQTVKG